MAFCAYIAGPEQSPSLHHILLFDIVKTNIGSAYNSNSGMIVVNSAAFDNMIVNSEAVNDVHSGTKVIVVSLSRGDVVYVRTDETYLSHGIIYSGRVNGYSSFCGWKL